MRKNRFKTLKVLAATAAIGFTLFTAFPAKSNAAGFVWGDCNGDGVINMSDLVTLSKWNRDGKGYRGDYDINGDGVVNSLDENVLWLKILGWY